MIPLNLVLLPSFSHRRPNRRPILSPSGNGFLGNSAVDFTTVELELYKIELRIDIAFNVGRARLKLDWREVTKNF